MPFTPEEIESKEFLVVLRGYDKEEVGSFLRAVAADVRTLQEEASTADTSALVVVEPVAVPEPEPVVTAVVVPSETGDAFADMGQEMASVLRAASDAAEAIRSKAEGEANEHVRIASEEAASVRRAADEEAEAILAGARAARSEASEEAARLREQAAQDAADARSNASREAEQLVEAALARRDRLTQEALELQHRLESAQETLHHLLEIVGDAQLGPESDGGSATQENGSGDTAGEDSGEAEGSEGEYVS
ncbi:MAG: DivIVA protein [Acidimicrobiales bacterium]|nr:DivIVA protein [Acidimicrobiales bacterium]